MNFCTFIEQNLDVIVAEWANFARTLSPMADGLTELALRDHCREILLAAATDMKTSESEDQRDAKSKAMPATGAPQTAATMHGAMREMDGFELPQLVAEFRALRASVLHLWRRSGFMQPSEQALEEISRFNEAIDQALGESVERYSSRIVESRDLFIAILGHELRNPLWVVDASSQLLEKPAVPEVFKRQAVGRIRRASATMSRLISDLLGYTRSRLGGVMALPRTDCDVRRLCEEALDAMRASHPERLFIGRLSGDLCMSGDPLRLEQAVLNLLSNAVQHGYLTSPITIDANADERDVVLTVTNFGDPIPAEILPRLFEPLVRGSQVVSASHERSKTSLGLGLFIVRDIAHGHGGSVEVESSTESGTVFTLRLPRQEPVMAP